MEGYKAFSKNLSCLGFQYKIGETYIYDGELKIFEAGFHFCKNLIDVFGDYEFNNNVRVAKIEAVGKIIQQGTKYCTDKIIILEEIPKKEIQNIIFEYEMPIRNIGTFNSGHHNSGNNNSGNYNTGHFNSGNYNTGCYNNGDYNTGYYNSGSRNVGNFNEGTHNAGDYNKGDYNTGHYNIGKFNSGFFNTNTPTIRLFNKDSKMSYNEFNNLDIDFSNLNSSKGIIKSLPNYDADIFYACTGIDWRNDK